MSEEKDTTTFETLDGLTSFMDSSVIDGHEVKEWNTSQFTRLYPYLSQIVSILMESGASFENLKTYLGENWPKLVDAIAPHMVPIILISVPTVTQEYLDAHPFTRGLEFIMAIFRRNIEHIADFFGQAGLAPENPAKDKA
jgi:hypothetical protein